MYKLMSNTDYEDSIDLPNVSDIAFRIKSRNHRQFLKQPLELYMFVPCKLVEGIWVVLEERIIDNYEREFGLLSDYEKYNKEYYQAKEKCLFEGFEIEYYDLGGGIINNKSSFQIFSKDPKVQICFYKSKPNYFVWNYKTIEDLVKYNLELTASAKKQLGL